MLHPGEDFITSAIADTDSREISTLPAFLVHRAVRAVARTKWEYSRLTQALWNTMFSNGQGWDQLITLRQADNPALTKIIRESRESIGTHLAQEKNVLIMASPASFIELLKTGYRVNFKTKTDTGTPYLFDHEGMTDQLTRRDDVVTGWRPWKTAIKTLHDRKISLLDIPRFVRCRLCSPSCGGGVKHCPYDPSSAGAREVA